MPDKTTLGISDTFRQFLEALVEEVVINGEPFDAQKKWLRKHSEAEGVSHEMMESNLSDLFEALKELEEHVSRVVERSVRFLAEECYLSETMVNKLIDNAAAVRTQKEVEKKAQEEREQKAREEAERKAREDDERKAREERDRIAKEKAQLQEKLDAERKAKEEAERIALAEKQAREEAERKAKEDAERKAREDRERKAKEEEERRRRERERKEAEQREKERIEAERKAKEEAERKVREEAQRKAELDAGDLSNFVYVENGMLDFKGEGFKEVQFPTQRVSVPSFHISKYLVTQQQWINVMGSYSAKGSIYENRLGDRLPAIVKWDDAQQFILKLNQLTGRKHRIPYESEWDFAAIGGRSTRNYRYSGSDDYNEIAWRSTVGLVFPPMLYAVGLKKPNELGLYDMCGNVEEWCDTGWPPPYFRGLLKGAPGYDDVDSSLANGDGFKSIWARLLAIQNETMASFRLCY